VDQELATLAATAASAVVKSLATAAADRVKSAVAGLWRRVHPERAETVHAELEETRTAVVAAKQAEDSQAEQDLVGEWRGRLGRLLTAEPELAADVRRILAEVLQPALQAAGQETSITNQATASGHGRVYQAGRDQHITER
jgi:hypothetical protein